MKTPTIAGVLILLLGLLPAADAEPSDHNSIHGSGVAEQCKSYCERLQNTVDRLRRGELDHAESEALLLQHFSEIDSFRAEAEQSGFTGKSVEAYRPLRKSLSLLLTASAEFYAGYTESNGLVVEDALHHLALSSWWLERFAEESDALAYLEPQP